MRIKEIPSLIALLIMLFLTSMGYAKMPKQVAITAIVEHPSLDNIRKGIVDELQHQGYQLGNDLIVDFKSAQGSSATAAQIAKQFVAKKTDVIVAIATPSAQAVVAATKTIPVIFSGITDPIAAKLMKHWQPSASNISGISDALPIEPQIKLMLEIKPELKRVGYVYSPGEVNSTMVLKQLKAALAKHDIHVIAVPAQRTSDVASAARSLKGKVDLIYTTTDNNVVSAYEALVKVATEGKILLIASDPDSVARGAAVALGMSYYDMGLQTGKMVGRVLQGEEIGTIMPQRGEANYLVLNVSAARQQGVTLPDSLIKKANKIIR